MRILIAGSWNNRTVKPGLMSHPPGFTLIELTMVILLVGFLLSLTVPRLRDVVLTDNLKTTVRILTATIKELRYQAIKDHTEHFLKFDFGSNRFLTDSPDMSDSFFPPSDVRVIDICIKGEEKKTSGEIRISFSKEGYISPGVIHLASEDGRQFTLSLSPFLGSVNLLEGYIEIEDVKM